MVGETYVGGSWGSCSSNAGAVSGPPHWLQLSDRNHAIFAPPASSDSVSGFASVISVWTSSSGDWTTLGVYTEMESSFEGSEGSGEGEDRGEGTDTGSLSACSPPGKEGGLNNSTPSAEWLWDVSLFQSMATTRNRRGDSENETQAEKQRWVDSRFGSGGIITDDVVGLGGLADTLSRSTQENGGQVGHGCFRVGNRPAVYFEVPSLTRGRYDGFHNLEEGGSGLEVWPGRDNVPIALGAWQRLSG